MSYSNCFPIIWTASLFRVIPKANRLYFAASKKHIGLYPGPAAVVQFSKGLPYPLESERVAVKTEPYPGRWTTHIVIGKMSDLDEELFAWVVQAYEFSEKK